MKVSDWASIVWKSTLFTLAVIVAVALALVPIKSGALWVAGFPDAEYQITFVDRSGNPIEGIELRVEDLKGTQFFYYPVTDYVPTSIPKSDHAGLLTFHHVGYGPEFSGRCIVYFGFIQRGSCSGPRYVCRFLLHAKEVGRIRFDDLSSLVTSKGSGTVSRKWSWVKNNPFPNYAEWTKSDPNWIDTKFDIDGDGLMSMEERAAWKCRHFAFSAASAFPTTANDELLEFTVVRKTIAIQL